MRRIVLISSSILAAGVLAFGVYLSAQSLAPQPAPGGGGTTTCTSSAKEEPDAAASDGDRAACNDTTGKPGEVKP